MVKSIRSEELAMALAPVLSGPKTRRIERGPEVEPLATTNYSISATTYNWIELLGDGAATLILGNVNAGNYFANPISLGSHTLQVYSTVATGNTGTGALYADSAGWLYINPAGGMAFDLANSDLTNSPAAATVAPLWHAVGANGYYAGSNMLFAKIVGTQLIVEWNQVLMSPSGVVPFTFEALMQLDTAGAQGDIIFQYKQWDPAVGSTQATVGLKEAAVPATFNALSSFNQANPLVGPGKAILFHWGPPPVQPPSGGGGGGGGTPPIITTPPVASFASISIQRILPIINGYVQVPPVRDKTRPGLKYPVDKTRVPISSALNQLTGETLSALSMGSGIDVGCGYGAQQLLIPAPLLPGQSNLDAGLKDPQSL